MSLRDIFVEIGMDIDDGPLRDMIAEIDNLMDSISNGNIDELEQDLQNMDQQVNNADHSMGSFRKTLLGIGGIIAGLGLGKVFLDVSKDAVNAAAEAQAMNAQFDQVFEGITDSAQKTIDQLGKDFGMAPNRLKPAMSQMTSMFKGLGLDTEKAMSTASQATTLVADAAAFYDKSFEDANGSLNSFIKGNYEGGESIGLFANETQLAAFAAKTLDQDWKKLDEAGKQLARLEYAKIMQESAGATGQASRESDSLTNQMGNLKQVWQDLLAEFGDPLLPLVIGYITDFSEKVKNFDPQPIIDGVTDMVLKTVEFGQSVKENWDPIKETIIGLGTAFLAFKGIMLGMTIIGTINTLIAAYRTGTLMATLAQYGLNTAMLANPVTWVVAAIAALIGIGVLLYRNWDTVTAKTKEVWDSIGGLGGAMGIILGPIGFLINAGIDLAKNWDSTKSVWENVWGAIQRSAATSVNAVVGLINEMIATINKIPGVNIPIVPKVDWGSAKADMVSSKNNTTMSYAEAVGSHATGLGRVPYDGYIAELHKDEAILTAEQSNALRSSGMLKGDGVAPSLSLGQDYEPLQGSPSNSTTTTNNRSSTIQASVVIQVDGSGNPVETGKSIKDELEEWFGGLSDVFPVVMEG